MGLTLVQRIAALRQLTLQGHAIGIVARRTPEELRDLLATQDLHLLQVWGLVEAEANRLLALPPESITAACPLFSCLVFDHLPSGRG